MWRHHRSSRRTFGKLCRAKYPHFLSNIKCAWNSWVDRSEIGWPTFAVKEEAEEVEVPCTGWLSLILLLLLLLLLLTVSSRSEFPEAKPVSAPEHYIILAIKALMSRFQFDQIAEVDFWYCLLARQVDLHQESIISFWQYQQVYILVGFQSS